MKVSCPSCDAKYTIADDKVVGKKIKVRCKTCSTQILVDGMAQQGAEPSGGADAFSASDSGIQPESFPPANPSMESIETDTWTVNLSESEERTMTTGEIVDAALKNELGPDVFVWKDGMGDWILYTDVPELRSAINSARKAAPKAASAIGSGAVGKTPAPSKAASKASTARATGGAKATGGKGATSVVPPPAEATEKRGPIVAAPGSALAKKMASAKAASLTPKAEPAPEKPKETKEAKETKAIPEKKAATRLASKRPQSTHDLFAGVAQAGSEIEVDTSEAQEIDHSRATGARNENSVLFSLDALKSGVVGGGGAAPRAAGPAPAAPSGRRAPAAPAKRLEDLMTIDAPSPMGSMGGGGGLLLSGNDALLTAPAPPPPKPEPKPVPVAAASAAGAVDVVAPRPKNKVAIIAGIIVGVGLVGTAGALVALKLAAPEAPAQPSATVAAKPSAMASAPVIPSSVPSASAAVAVASSAPEQPAASTTPSGPKTPGPAQGKVTLGKGEIKEPKTTDKKPDSKPEPAVPAAAGGFSKEAAVAALSVAASQATVCKKPEGPWGTGKCQVTFAPSGRVTSANVMGAPFAGTPVGGCVSSVFRRARVPSFNGDAVTVSKSFTISP